MNAIHSPADFTAAVAIGQQVDPSSQRSSLHVPDRQRCDVMTGNPPAGRPHRRCSDNEGHHAMTTTELFVPPQFWLPKSFEPENVLPTVLKKRADDARWLVSTITRKMAFGDVDDLGFVRLHSSILKRTMSKRTYAAVAKALVDAGVLASIAPHSAGLRSRGYRLTEKYLNERHRLVAAKDRHLIKRIRRETEQMRQEQMKLRLPIHNELERIQQESLTITPAADTILETMADPARLGQAILVHHIRHRIPKFTVSKTGRVFNWITGLSRQLRPALRLDGEPIAGVDIRCAQPALLAALMDFSRSRNVPTYIHSVLPRSISSACPSRPLLAGLPCLMALSPAVEPTLDDDFLAFDRLVRQGRLYETLVDLCHASGVVLPDGSPPDRSRRSRHRARAPDNPRDAVKLWILRDILAKRGCYPSQFEDVFKQAFPSVWSYVRAINRRDHGELIRALQRLESFLVIENVAPRLVGRIPILTLHDAIYGRVRDLPIIETAFQETFNEMGLHLQIKAELPTAGTPPVIEPVLSLAV